ncbi:MAG: TIGR03936 family radical SAM-associated protein [Planctomycetota bacterium]
MSEQPQRDSDAPLRLRYRIRFAKTGLLRWTSHRDLATLWERIVRRAQLKLSMSEGFHPKPRIGFVSALALGINGENEVVELDLAEHLSAAELLRRLVQDDQPGLRIKSVQLLPEGSGKAKLVHTEYVITTPDPDLGAPPLDRSAVQSAIESLLAKETVTVERKKKPLTANIAEQILQLSFTKDEHHGEAIKLTLAASDGATLKPTDVLDLIECSDWVPHGSQINRTEVVLQREFETTDPECYATAIQPPQTQAVSPNEVP